jgi:hypothetical protein
MPLRARHPRILDPRRRSGVDPCADFPDVCPLWRLSRRVPNCAHGRRVQSKMTQRD